MALSPTPVLIRSARRLPFSSSFIHKLGHVPPWLALTVRQFTPSTDTRGQHSSGAEDKDPEPMNVSNDIQKPRKNSPKTSLRRVAVEAQRSTSFVKSRGRTRFIPASTPTRTVTAYCGAETYDIAIAAQLLKKEGLTLDPFATGLYPQVIHLQVTRKLEKDIENTQHDRDGDVFVFPSGTVVTWNVQEREALRLVNTVLAPAAEGAHPESLETEDLEYLQDINKETSEMVGDTIVLGTKPAELFSATETPPTHPGTTPTQPHATDTTLTKIAFSSGLARSTKLAVLESLLAAYQASTRDIPATLAAHHPPSLFILSPPFLRPRSPFTRSFILRKTGHLLSIRAQLNLYSELTDSMPDMFWDTPPALNLGGYYDQVGRALDVGARIRVLNEKIGFAQEIASVLREQLSERHGLRLEWAIIALIAVEVVLEVWRHVEEGRKEKEVAETDGVSVGQN